MTAVGCIHIWHDLDRGIVLQIDTSETSKFDNLEGEGENIREALEQLLTSVGDLVG